MKNKYSFKSPIEAIFGDDFDLGLFLHIARRNLLWVILLMVIGFSLATLFLRYQVPSYQATSTLMLKGKNSPNLIDIEDLLESNTNQAIEQEVEWIKSSTFLVEALKSLPLDVVLYNKGNVLQQEYYKNEPFVIKHKLLDSTFTNHPIYIQILSNNKFELSYSYKGEDFKKVIDFGVWDSVAPFKINLQLNANSNVIPKEGYIGLNQFFVFKDPTKVRRRIADKVNIGLANYDANKMAVSYIDPSPTKSIDIVNTISSAIISYEYEVKAESADQVIKFLSIQIEELKRDLLASENELRKFKEVNKLIDPITEEQYLRGQYVSLESRALKLSLEETTLNWLEAYVKDTVNNIATILPPTSEFIDFSPFVQTIGQLQEERRGLLASVQLNDPRVALLDDQIYSLKREFKEGLANAREKLSINQAYLQDQIDDNDREFGELPEKEAEFVRLVRLNEIREKFYLLLLERQAEFQIARAGLVSDYILLEPAYEAKQISVEKGYLQAAAVGLGLFIGFSLIVFRYLFHNTISSLRNLEKHCKAGILGVVPRVREALNEPSMVINNSPKSLISEAFRSLRTNIDFLVQNKTSPLLAITSTISGEGKTFIIANLALVHTLLGRRVLVLDFDMRKPKLHSALGLSNALGSSTVLSGSSSIQSSIQKTEYEGLDVLTSGPVPPNPAELVASESADRLLAYAQKNYDLVLVDTPPLGLVADAMEILGRADLPIYVVRANYSNRSFIKNINDIVEDGKIKNMVSVLNDAGMGGTSYGADGYGLGYGYSYGYGYGYGYGYRYRNRGGAYGYGYYTDLNEYRPLWKRILGVLGRGA